MLLVQPCFVTLPTPLAGAAPPSRLPVVPAAVSGKVTGRDGRAWSHPDPNAVVRYLENLGRPLVLDENHSELLRAPKGESSPAMARLSKFSVESDGTIWANQVEWSPMGRERWPGYLGISPTFLFDSARSTNDTLGQIVGLHSVGLTNDPNLSLPAAMNAASLGIKMELTAEQVQKMIADATAGQAAAITALTTQLAALKPADKTETAPNASELSKVLESVKTVVAEAKSTTDAAKAQLQDGLKVAANAAVNAAVQAGKIQPIDESKAFWVDAYLRDAKTAQEQLDRMRKLTPEEIKLAANKSDKPALSAEQKKMAQSMGIPEAEFVPAPKG